MTLGQRIAACRKAKGYTQEELAERVEVTRQAVSKWELDEAQPDAGNLVRLAQALGVTTDRLLLGEEMAEAAPPEGEARPGGGLAGRLEGLAKKHGHKVGYVLMAWGGVCLALSLVALVLLGSLFSPGETTFLWSPGESGGGYYLEPSFPPTPNTSTPSPEELEAWDKAVENYLEEHGSLPTRTDSGVPAGIQLLFYAAVILSVGWGGCLIWAGRWVVKRHKTEDEE